MIRQNKSKELLASMREANQLAETLNHYEIQRNQWMQTHGSRLQEKTKIGTQADGFMDGLRKIKASMRQVIQEVQERTLNNADLLARMVKRGQDLLQEVMKASGSKQTYGAGDTSPSLFVDQRV